MPLPDVVSGLLLSEGSEVQILLATGFKAFENVSWISWQRTLLLFSNHVRDTKFHSKWSISS